MNWYHQVRSYGARNLAVNVWFAPFVEFDSASCAVNAGAGAGAGDADGAGAGDADGAGLILHGPPLSSEFFFDDEQLFPNIADPNECKIFHALETLVHKQTTRKGMPLLPAEFHEYVKAYGLSKVSKASIDSVFNGFDHDSDGAVW